MTLDQHVAGRATSQHHDAARPATPPRPRTRRQPKWIAAGVLALCLGGVGASVLYAQVTDTHTVVVVSRALAKGETVRPGDLGAVTLNRAAGVSCVPASDSALLIGQRAIVDLPAGSVLPAGTIGDPVTEPGRAQLGLRLAPGRIPGTGLARDTRVLLVPVTDQPVRREPAIRAKVVSGPTPGPDQSSILIDVSVEQSEAQRAAELAGTDRVVVVREAEN